MRTYMLYRVLQGVHTETGFRLVWLNRFTESSFKEPLTFTLFVWNQFRLHVIS